MELAVQGKKLISSLLTRLAIKKNDETRTGVEYFNWATATRINKLLIRRLVARLDRRNAAWVKNC